MCFLKTAAIYRKQSEATAEANKDESGGSPCTITGAIVFAHMVRSKMGEGDRFAYERDVNIALITNNAKNNCKLGYSTQLPLF